MFDSKFPISFYKEIAPLHEEHQICIVQHIETRKIYIKKVMSIYNMDVYEELFRHPVRNIPRIYAMYETEQTLTIIEEYISGDTLQEIIDICTCLSPYDVLTYSIQLCTILNDLHNANPPIIHRDIKPSNVMITEDGRVVLIDLNAAKQFHTEKARDTKLIGTEGFAAPEQFGFGSSTSRTDIYAIGMLMQTLLGPVASNNPMIQPIIQKCLEMNPKDRYSSAEELRNVLQFCFSKINSML